MPTIISLLVVTFAVLKSKLKVCVVRAAKRGNASTQSTKTIILIKFSFGIETNEELAAFSNGWKQKNENDVSKKEYFNLLNNNPQHQNDNNYRGTFNQINLLGSTTPRDVNYRIASNDAGLKNGNGKISNQFSPNFYNVESLSSLKNFIGYKLGSEIQRSRASSERNKRNDYRTEFPNNLHSLHENYDITAPYYYPNANSQEHVHHFNPTSYLNSASDFNWDHNQHPGATFSPYIGHNKPRPVYRHMANTINFRERSPEDHQEVELQPHTTCECQEGNSPGAPLNSHFANPVMGHLHHTMPSPQKTCSRCSCANSPHSHETCCFNNQAQCCGRFPMSTNCNCGRDCRCNRFNALGPHPAYETPLDVPIPHQEVSCGNFLQEDHDHEGFQDNNTPPNPLHVNLIQTNNLAKTPAQAAQNNGTKTQTMEGSDNCKTSIAKETDTCGCCDNSERFGEFKGRILCCPNGLTLIVDYLSMPSICN